jgi:hypothetical protein
MGPSNPFRVYAHESGLRWLVISGVGKVAAAAAVAHLAAVSAARPEHGWINLGLCGHSDGEVGQLFRANKLIDVGSGRAFYPPLITESSCPLATLHTVDQPSSDYPEPGMYDMEASGFYASACRYSSQELIQIFKIVSDTPAAPLRRYEKTEVSAWIGGGLDDLESAIAGLLELSEEEAQRLADPRGLAAFLGNWHFSETQQIQLHRLLCRWGALTEFPLEIADFEELLTSRELLRVLTDRLEALPIRWGER